MANTNVFRGSDASLVLAVDDSSTVEGGLADGLISKYEFSNIIGRLRDVTVHVENDVRAYHEIGKRLPSELRPGNVSISGSASRAHINGAMLHLLLGAGAKSPSPAENTAQPTFNIVINLKNPSLPDNSSTVTIFGVKFDSWSFKLPEDDFVMEGITFKALRISTEEQG
ncbi:MAG: hypothetical protein RLZZ165_1621 [Bacteroidota bacterium]|jgi:hypothetical protein